MSARWLGSIGAVAAAIALMGGGIQTAVAKEWPFDPRPSGCLHPDSRRPIDLVICLDTSGSMSALIDSARGRLWDIVSSLSKAKPTPRLRVGLLTYGSPRGASARGGWVIRQADLTGDLDSVYAKMMALSTDGGDEFVGWVLHDAVRTMSWSRHPDALKIIFVAGNESADQASDVFNFRSVAETARAQGIVINSIYAGAHAQGVNERWHEVASAGGGDFTAIDMQCGTVQITTPHDKALLELNMKLNATYIPYGPEGRVGAANQQEQDAMAKRMGAQTAAGRVAAKATPMYDNAQWDLVDAVAEGDVRLEDIKDSDLPAPVQALPAAEREEYVARQRQARADVQAQIAEISAEREAFLRRAKAEQQQPGQVALDDAMQQSLRKQAEAKGFAFE